MSTHAISNAEAWMENIREMVEALDNKDPETAATAATEIYESPLSLLVRSGWTAIDGEMTPEEYEILLSTGGPALRIIGTLRNQSPDTARLEWQDWGTPWTEYVLSSEDEDILRRFAEQFLFE